MLSELLANDPWHWMFRQIRESGIPVSIEKVTKIVGIVTPRHRREERCPGNCLGFLGLFELADGRSLGVKACCDGSPVLHSGEIARISSFELLQQEFFDLFDRERMGIATHADRLTLDREIYNHDEDD